MMTELANVINLGSKLTIIVATHLFNGENSPSMQYSYHQY